MGKLDPIVSEFDTEEEAEAYDVWFRAKVEAALADPRPRIPHDEVMAEMHQLLAQSRASDAEVNLDSRIACRHPGGARLYFGF